ncbi:hypothetical protein MRB53_019748 [Persea americana]|uniref:Uncharacterized protein n=1 Tax=Persea americana TaxID=3435 RepID=A0ACC2KYV4_PERAE|nr:hypothetical protein MRB53_019748 [Persea americana]
MCEVAESSLRLFRRSSVQDAGNRRKNLRSLSEHYFRRNLRSPDELMRISASIMTNVCRLQKKQNPQRLVLFRRETASIPHAKNTEEEKTPFSSVSKGRSSDFSKCVEIGSKNLGS